MSDRPTHVSWAEYYRRTGGRPPRDTVLAALDAFDGEGAAPPEGRLAVDLGCGAGRDAVEMLRRGWRVLGIDAEADAIARLLAIEGMPADLRARLSGAVARFEDAAWPPCHLVSSSFALPLCPPDRFDALWAHIHASLLPGGRFAGQLYGDRDTWAGRPGMTFHTGAQVDARLAGWNVEMRREVEEDSTTPRGEAKHWHVFHLVLRKA
ncbi:MAG: trans-aconitate 2-methyltransferase [Alphaproteobacteria bacterium]